MFANPKEKYSFLIVTQFIISIFIFKKNVAPSLSSFNSEMSTSVVYHMQCPKQFLEYCKKSLATNLSLEFRGRAAKGRKGSHVL